MAEPKVNKIIKDLKKNFAGSNEDQMKGLQLLKGLATSDEDLANKFMKKLDKAITDIANELVKEESVIEISEEIEIPGTDIVLEKGDRIQIINEQKLS